MQRLGDRLRIAGDAKEPDHPVSCSQLRSVATLTPIMKANSVRDAVILSWRAFTPASRKVVS